MRFRRSGVNWEGRKWTLSGALDTLADQIEAEWPDSEGADGTVASKNHDATSPGSDHRPRPLTGAGIVRAIDIGGQEEVDDLVEAIRLSRDIRVRYVIRYGRIFSSYLQGSRPAWQWGEYSGSNPHKTHAHVSVLPGADRDTRLWEIGDTDMALLTKEEEQQLRDFLNYIKAEQSNVGFVTQAIQDIRERNVRGPAARDVDLKALAEKVGSGSGLSEERVKQLIRETKLTP